MQVNMKMKTFKGSSLVEAIFAIFIFSLLALIVFKSLLSLSNISNLEDERYMLSNEATNAIECAISNREYNSDLCDINIEKSYYDDYYIIIVKASSKETDLNVQFQRYIQIKS